MVDSKRLHIKRGSSLIEVMVAMAILAIVGLGVAQSAIYGIKYQKSAEIGNVARNLAISKAERLSAIPLNTLDNSYDSIESNLTAPGHTIIFRRTTDITVNADGSRSIDITVSTTNPVLLNVATYSTRFAPWES